MKDLKITWKKVDNRQKSGLTSERTIDNITQLPTRLESIRYRVWLAQLDQLSPNSVSRGAGQFAHSTPTNRQIKR